MWNSGSYDKDTRTIFYGIGQPYPWIAEMNGLVPKKEGTKNDGLYTDSTLALDPELMLLDEPTQGMGHEDVEHVVTLIKRVSQGRTIMMVEHNLDVVANLSDTITVLARGAVLAEGPYSAVSKNPQVLEAYVGQEATA